MNKFNLNEIREEHEDFGIGCNIIDRNIKMINDDENEDQEILQEGTNIKIGALPFNKKYPKAKNILK